MLTIVDRLQNLGGSLLRSSCGIGALTILNEEVAAIQDKLGRPLNILEIGTFHGFSSLVLAQYGKVHTLDIMSKEKTQWVLDLFPDLRQNIIRFIAYDQIYIREMVITKAPFDVVFVDGSHREADVRIDLQYVIPLSDTIFCHDYQDRFPGSMKAIDEIKEQYSFRKWGGTSGLCILQKEQDERL